MNKKKNFIILSISMLLFVALALSYSIFAGKTEHPIDKEKLEGQLKHDKIEKQNIEKSKNQKPEEPDEKALSEDPANYDEFGIFDASDIQLPLPSQEAKKYKVVSAGLSPYNGIYTGNLLEDPSVGIIINRYERIKSGEIKTYFYKLKGTGQITLVSLSSDKKIFTFKTENGKTGIFDVTDSKGSYSIN